MKNISIRVITKNKKAFLSLLLLGDELESDIDKYLERGDLFALYSGDVKSVCAVTDEGGGTLEVQNLATDARYQRKGYASHLLSYIAEYYTGRYSQSGIAWDKIILGTGDVPGILAFYEGCGFTITHRIPDYFITHFDYPIIEDGVMLKDKVYLTKSLPSKSGIVLQTERLYLREMTRDDFPLLCKHLQDTDVMYAWEHAYSDEEVWEGINKQFERYKEHGFGVWAVILKETEELIGQCGLSMQPCEDREVLEIGYIFQKAYWHKGYATETAVACKEYAFDKLNADEVFSLIRDTNIASQNVAIRNGMSVRGSYVKHYRGIDMPHLIFSVKRNEYEIEIVKRLSGTTDNSRISISEIGWTSRVYIIDGGKIIFKFPRNKKFKDECKKEAAVLELLRKHSFNVSTPILNWTTDDTTYFGFYGVVGKPLGEVIHTLTDEQKINIGTQLGEFLKQLHGITDYGEMNAQTLEEQIAEYTKMYQKDRNLLEAFFDESELKIIDDFFSSEVPMCMTGSGEIVFCHGDLDYNNTLVDDKNHVGVIDFGDAGLYDRSQDFRGMDDDTLREAMMKAYGGGEILNLAAAKATAKMIDILNLPYIIKNRDAAERNECIKRIRAESFNKNGG